VVAQTGTVGGCKRIKTLPYADKNETFLYYVRILFEMHSLDKGRYIRKVDKGKT
jgi:hypothetical protein